MSVRPIKRVIKSKPTLEGAGVHLRRAFGFGDTSEFDPFLLLDDFRNDVPADYLAGFPWHPHRGIETITYVLSGTVEHGDSLGHSGTISAGDVQWMTAGSGIIHQEMPKGDRTGRMHGFQLWANLPSSLKMTSPRYQEVKSGEIPVVTDDDATQVRIVSGEFWGKSGPVDQIAAEPIYLDVIVPPRKRKVLAVETTRHAFAYVFAGSGKFCNASAPLDVPTEPVGWWLDETPPTEADNRSLILFDRGDEVQVEAGEDGIRFLLVSGKPLEEPVAWYGPIVMNTQEQLRQAFTELRQGTFLKRSGAASARAGTTASIWSSLMKVAAEQCVALGGARPSLEAYPTRPTSLGALEIARALPVRGRRLVGPWCFLDRYGPLSFIQGKPMDVGSHPHVGLQTVTWLLEGEVVHNDSLGFQSLARPGGVNVMTSGSGIAHAEETPSTNTGRLSGVQLWVALPDACRNINATFEHVAEVPVVEMPGGIARVFAGSFSGVSSPAKHYSEIVGAELQVLPHMELVVPVDNTHEHAILLLSGEASLEGQRIEERSLYYLGRERQEIAIRSPAGSRLLLVGGPPFPETILMWWNFVARTPEEIAHARGDWERGERFGSVRAYSGPRLSAPPLIRLAAPNPAS